MAWRHFRFLVLALIGCAEPRSRSDTATVNSSRNPPLPYDSRAQNYLGAVSRNDAAFAEYLRLDSLKSGALYDGLRWIRICDRTYQDERFSFRTAPMFGRVDVFEGISDGEALRGELITQSTTGVTQRRDSVVFRPLDDTPDPGPSSHSHLGFYSDLRYIEEAGDNVGAELLLASMTDQLTVTLAIMEGAPVTPLLGFNLVDTGDTLRFRISRSGPIVTAVFLDSLVQISPANEIGPPRRLSRVHSIRSFSEQPPVGECSP